MTRVMFDSNAIDAILKHEDAARILAAGITVAITTVQEDELHRIADTARRRALFDLLHALKAERIAPAALSWDASADAVIAATAAQTCDLLVSDDRHLAAPGGLRVLNYAAFRAEFLPTP